MFSIRGKKKHTISNERSLVCSQSKEILDWIARYLLPPSLSVQGVKAQEQSQAARGSQNTI
jgi:hypothetical protein